MSQILEFDCRSICQGRRCPYLHPGKDLKINKTIKMFICKDKNLVIVPEILDPGKPSEKIIIVGPFNSCIQMRKLQSEGLAQWAEASINPDGTITHWNPPLNII
ncbi:MAG: hypothetical protein UR43_C0028G0010 [candidate division TM6 bacterium GW2011_GWF2_33_332]|nr:MAG: hypothetical protein UR43_C0028G0010 [candidate division TM6 bacterium GW2011_GWF2_33_332]